MSLQNQKGKTTVLSHNTVRRLNCSTVTVGRSADVRTALLPYRRIPATKIHVYVLVRAQHRVLININSDGCFHTYIYTGDTIYNIESGIESV